MPGDQLQATPVASVDCRELQSVIARKFVGYVNRCLDKFPIHVTITLLGEHLSATIVYFHDKHGSADDMTLV